MNQQQQQQQRQQQPLQQRLLELKREEAALKQQLAVQQYAAQYPIQLQWPAMVKGKGGGVLRTDMDLLQHRLLESGLLYDTPVATADAVAAASNFIANLESSDCFHSIHVDIGGSGATPGDDAVTSLNQETNNVPARKITVTVDEKKWYRLHAGAGLKTNGWLTGTNNNTSLTTSTDSFLPAAELEVSVGLRNIAGCLDRTDVQYAVDTHNIGTWGITHVRPLYTALPEFLSDQLLLEQITNGSQCALTVRAALDTVDHITVSSYQQYQRLLSVKAATAEIPPRASTDTPWYYGSLEWSVNWRDLVPRRHATLPYHLAASPEIAAQAGASVKHSVTAVMHYDTTKTAAPCVDDASGIPVQGVQMQCSTELATPPGDVGFVKSQAAMAGHLSVTDRLAMHASLSTGYLHPLSFAGLCGMTTVSDRFLMGGSGSFRGFAPGGVGPRAIGKMGDALGGNFFYAASVVASFAPPVTLESLSVITSHVRLFGFCSVGTCLGNVTGIQDIVKTTRVSAGMGLTSQAFGPRLEATYAWPLRYGPLDGRRRFQFGLSLFI
jgi:hypothetical protein